MRRLAALFAILAITAARPALAVNAYISNFPPATSISPLDKFPDCALGACGLGTPTETATASQLSTFFNANLPASVGLTPMEYGAVGNGVADDTAAVQAAINAAEAMGVPLIFDSVHLYHVTASLTVTSPVLIEGPFRYGLWTTSPTNARSCPWGLTTTANTTLFNVSAITATITSVCMQLGPSTGSGVSATAGAAIQFAPPSTSAYQTGIVATYNTILNPYDGITLDGAGYSAGCCGEGTTADGNFIARNTIVNFADHGISIGKNTANGATVGNTVWDNALGCINATSKANGIGVALYDGAVDYDGTGNGPEGCHIGVAVIPGTVNGVGQNAQLDPARGVLGDQSAVHDLWIEPQTSLGIVAFSEIDNGWTGSGGATDNGVLIDNPNGGVIQGIKFIGGYFHSAANQSVPVVDIEGNPSSAGSLGEIAFTGASIDCWGGGTCSAPLLKINGAGSGQPRNITVTGGQVGVNDEAGNSTATTGILVSGIGSAFMAFSGIDLSSPATPISFTSNNVNYRILASGNAGIDDVCSGNIASAATISLPNLDSCDHITGTTAITEIGNLYGNRNQTLIADSGVTFNTGGAAQSGASAPICNAVTVPAGGMAQIRYNLTGACVAVSQ